MEQGRIERNRIRLINAERTILELYLLVYLLYFISWNSVLDDHYLWLILATGVGIIAYVIFGKYEFSVGIGLLLSALATAPFIMLDYPLFIVFLLFLYVFWRLQANFSQMKSNGWPYLILNTILFAVFYILTLQFFVNVKPHEIVILQIKLYLLTTVLYFVVRFTVISIAGRHLNDFNIGDVGKAFGALLCIGVAAFMAVYFLFEPIRNGIVLVAGFIFGGLYMGISKGIIAPIWDWVLDQLTKKRAEQQVDDVHSLFTEFEEERKIFGEYSAVPDVITFALMVIGAIAIFIYLIRKKNQLAESEEGMGALFRSGGRRQELKATKLLYDYSAAANVIRNNFKEFEQEAQSKNAPRLRGETVKEWFIRMGWEQNEVFFDTYSKVRYGAHDVTEEDGKLFLVEIEKIKNKYFIKEV